MRGALRWLAVVLVLAACSRGTEEPALENGAETATPNLPGALDAQASPTEALQRFYDALAAGRLDDALPLMVPLSDAALRERLPEDLGKVVEMCLAGELRLEAKEHEIQGRWACVVTRHALTRDGQTTVDVREEFLLKTPDGWRVASEPMRKDPALAPLWDADALRLLSWFRANHDDFVSRYR